MAKIDDAAFDRMYQFSGIDKKKLQDSLRKMASEFKGERTVSYVTAEFVFCYFAPKGSFSYALTIPDDENLHWFVRWPNGFIVDLVANRVHDYSQVNYESGKKRKFYGPCPSTLARKLAVLMEVDDWSQNADFVMNLP